MPDPKPSPFRCMQDGINILAIFQPLSVEIAPVPNSFPNGTPAHSHSAYISVEMDYLEDLPAQAERILLELGWKKECQGAYWTFTC